MTTYIRTLMIILGGWTMVLAEEPLPGLGQQAAPALWAQWRGPDRDGQVKGPAWPARLNAGSFIQSWRVPCGPSYSGPIISEDLVFTTETKDKDSEVVVAFDRLTGAERWRTEWKGALRVPFFAASNGSWIRSTPAFDGQFLYVAGMRDVLVCLEAKTGKEQWRVDFVATFKSELPAFGCVCSPLLDGDALYVQAGASVVRLNKKTGEIIWRGIQDDGGMNGSAFSSPIIAELAGKRQLVVQTRDRLVGADLATGALLWEQKVPAFRGMNILTPVVIGDAVFTSSYQNKSWLYQITKTNDQFTVKEAWSNNAQGYMSTPVVIGDHIYMHLQSQRFTCINIKTGERTWTSTSFGKYCSLIAQGDRIVALDANGTILYLKANPVAFELIDRFPVSESDTWAHLAVSGNQWFVRELDGLIAFRWGG